MESRSKIRKEFIVLLCIIVITTIWYFEKSRQIPQYSAVFYEMGLSCENKCGQNKQLRYFQKAVLYKPKLNDSQYRSMLSDAYFRSALIYERKGSRAKSLKSLLKAIEWNQKNSLAYYKIGLHYFNEGAYEYALRYFMPAAGLNALPGDVHYYLARSYDELKIYDLSILYYVEATLYKDNYVPEVYARLAEIYHFLNKSDIETLLAVNRLRHLKRNDLADRLEQNFRAVGFQNF